MEKFLLHWNDWNRILSQIRNNKRIFAQKQRVRKFCVLFFQWKILQREKCKQKIRETRNSKRTLGVMNKFIACGLGFIKIFFPPLLSEAAASENSIHIFSYGGSWVRAQQR